uniref:Amyloid beta (A4) precursor-like protein 2 n=1 Tax=Hucho hucho TaxID=62062 RepID=A0A4W5L0M8_9TELE
MDMCVSHQQWHGVAKEACSKGTMVLHSYGMLLPCGIDKFHGTEYVCCPSPGEPSLPAMPSQEEEEEDEEEDEEVEETALDQDEPVEKESEVPADEQPTTQKGEEPLDEEDEDEEDEEEYHYVYEDEEADREEEEEEKKEGDSVPESQDEDKTLAEVKAVCTLEAETGPCRASMPRWHFDMTTRKCVRFVYGGCAGNRNNFESEEYCMAVCKRLTVPPTPQPTDDVDVYFETPADDKEHKRFQKAKEQLEIRHRNRMERVRRTHTHTHTHTHTFLDGKLIKEQ